MTTARRVRNALDRRGLLVWVDGVETQNGEVLVWFCGLGHVVSSVAAAVRLAEDARRLSAP